MIHRSRTARPRSAPLCRLSPRSACRWGSLRRGSLSTSRRLSYAHAAARSAAPLASYLCALANLCSFTCRGFAGLTRGGDGGAGVAGAAPCRCGLCERAAPAGDRSWNVTRRVRGAMPRDQHRGAATATWRRRQSGRHVIVVHDGSRARRCSLHHALLALFEHHSCTSAGSWCTCGHEVPHAAAARRARRCGSAAAASATPSVAVRNAGPLRRSGAGESFIVPDLAAPFRGLAADDRRRGAGPLVS